jgi:hypothetical protein
MGVIENSDIEIECNVEASPRSVNYWMKIPNPKKYQSLDQQKHEIIQKGDKHDIKEKYVSAYLTKTSLKIRNFSESDEGSYMCISSNTFGKANRTIRLYGEFQHYSVAHDKNYRVVRNSFFDR